MPFQLFFLAGTGCRFWDAARQYCHLSSLEKKLVVEPLFLSLSEPGIQSKMCENWEWNFLGWENAAKEFFCRTMFQQRSGNFWKVSSEKIPNVLSRSQVHNTSVFFFSQPLNAPNYPRLLSPFQQDFDFIKESNVWNALESFLLLLLVGFMDFSQEW